MNEYMRKAGYIPEMRFPPNDRGTSEVTTYKISKEELRKKYEPPLQARISKDTLYELRKKKLTNAEIARKYGVEPDQIKALFQYYREQDRRNQQGREEKSVTKEDLTKEKYVELKRQGLTDVIIRKRYGMHNVHLYNLKRDWGLVGMKVDRPKAPDKEEDSEIEKLQQKIDELQVKIQALKIEILKQDKFIEEQENRIDELEKTPEEPDHTSCKTTIRELSENLQNQIEKNKVLKATLKVLL